jgi:hypothetical protein
MDPLGNTPRGVAVSTIAFDRLRDWAERVRSNRAVVVYGAVVVAWAVAAAITAGLRSVFPDTSIYLLFTTVVVAAGLLGGLGPGLAATALSFLAGMAIEDHGSPAPLLSPYIFAAIGVIATFGGALACGGRPRGPHAAQTQAEPEAQIRSI